MFNMFKSPYLDGDNGNNLGGGATEPAISQPVTQAGQQTEQPKFKVKFNHEEKELTYDEAVQYAQKGMNYDRIYPEYEKLKNDPRLSFVETQAKKYGMTTEQYLDAVAKAEEEEEKNQLIQKNIPPEYAQEMLENRKFRQEYQSERQANQQREAKNKMYQEFIDAYPDVNPTDVPPEVWQEVKSGRTLTDAYTRYENRLLREKLGGAQTQQQTQQANQANAAASTGSAKSGKATQGFISKETYEQNRKNQKWMDANYDNVVSSMKHW
jgi:hypothetical protein